MEGGCFFCGTSAYEACKHREKIMERPIRREEPDRRTANPFSRNGLALAKRWHRDRARARLPSDELPENEAAAYLGMTPHALELRRYRKCGPEYLYAEGFVVYRIADLDKWRSR